MSHLTNNVNILKVTVCGGLSVLAGQLVEVVFIQTRTFTFLIVLTS